MRQRLYCYIEAVENFELNIVLRQDLTVDWLTDNLLTAETIDVIVESYAF